MLSLFRKKTTEPKLSARTAVLMRTKDRPEFLARAIRSVVAQTDTNWCLTIINDGGDQAALEATVQRFQKDLSGKFQLIHFATSRGRGMGEHLNAGIAATDSEFLAIHDDDDSWSPEFLEKTRNFLGSGMGVVTQSWKINEEWRGQEFVETDREIYEAWQTHEISLYRLAENLTFPPIAFLFRRTAVSEIGEFDDQLGPLEDWEFALRFFSRYEVAFLEEPLANYHHRVGANAGASANSKLNAAKIYGRLDQKIRNKLLREDIARGKVGLGFLVNMSAKHAQVIHHFSEFSKSSDVHSSK